VIRRFLVLSILLVAGASIYGQVQDSATAGVVPLEIGGYFSYFDASYASNRTAGFGVLLDYSPALAGNLGVEGESRWLTMGGSHGFSEYNYLVGPRYRFYKSDKYQPYAKFLIGAGEINFPYNLAHGGYFVLAPGGGVDFAVKDHWKLRADYEFQIWPGGVGIPEVQTGSLHPNGVSVGVTYRLFRSRYEFQPQQP
jgi:opacity protein-like surface antigen